MGWFLLSPLPGLADGGPLAMSSCGRPSVCVCVLTSSSYKDPSHHGLGPPAGLHSTGFSSFMARSPNTVTSPSGRSRGSTVQNWGTVWEHNSPHNRVRTGSCDNFIYDHSLTSPNKFLCIMKYKTFALTKMWILNPFQRSEKPMNPTSYKLPVNRDSCSTRSSRKRKIRSTATPMVSKFL